jgi:O-antigen/teichoic acid export membrane protein
VAKWFGDYRAVVVLLMVKAVFSFLGSHWMAKQPYRWRFHREYIIRMLRFGWPLVVTALLMFGVMQGDQFLVATFYTMSDLGPYAAAAALTMAPTFFFGRVFNSIALPLMAKVQDDASGFRRRYRLIIAIICAFSATYVFGVIVGAEALMQVVYGKKYAGVGIILGWLAAANGFRNIRIAPAIAAISRGDSKNQMVSNLARVLTLIPALGVAISGQPIWMIASMGVLGEALACFVSFRRLTSRDNIPLALSLYPTLLVLSTVLLAGTIFYLEGRYLHPAVSLAFAVLGSMLTALVVVILLPDLRHEATRFIETLRTAGLRGCISLLSQSKAIPTSGPATVR